MGKKQLLVKMGRGRGNIFTTGGQMKFKLNDTVSYRLAEQEVVVVDTENSGIFYFTKESKDFFEFFSEPRSLESYARRVPTEESELPASEYLDQFVDFLTTNFILKPVGETGVASVPEPAEELPRPVFLRQTVFDGNLTLSMPSTPIITIC